MRTKIYSIRSMSSNYVNLKTYQKMKKSTRILLRVAVTIVAYILFTDPWPLNKKNDHE